MKQNHIISINDLRVKKKWKLNNYKWCVYIIIVKKWTTLSAAYGLNNSNLRETIKFRLILLLHYNNFTEYPYNYFYCMVFVFLITQVIMFKINTQNACQNEVGMYTFLILIFEELLTICLYIYIYYYIELNQIVLRKIIGTRV